MIINTVKIHILLQLQDVSKDLSLLVKGQMYLETPQNTSRHKKKYVYDDIKIFFFIEYRDKIYITKLAYKSYF